MSLFNELKRRHVFRIGIAYLVVAWLIVQVVAAITPMLDLPNWLGKTVLVLLGVGFLVALILAWAFEMTPEGVKRTDELDEAAPRRPVSIGRTLNVVILAALVLAVGFLVWRQYSGAPVQTAQTVPILAPVAKLPASDALPNSVAVLPFENLSPDPKDAYFASGLHQEVIDQISKIHSMRVIARPSVMQYAKETKPIPQIAHELHVETVMAGSVRFANDRVRVSAELVDGVTGTNLWSDTYERPLGDVFKIEADIAMNVANALQAQFSPEEQARIEKAPTKSPEAYALFLQAITATNRGDSTTGISLLQRATTIDPQFALAYAETALSQAFKLVNTVNGAAVSAKKRTEIETLSRKNAERAIEIDPNIPMAYAALAVPSWLSWHWSDAAKDFSHALEVEPNDEASLGYYGLLLSAQGRHDEAIALAKRAVELDPSHPNAGQYGVQLGGAGQYEAAVDVLERAAAAYPMDVLTRLFLARAEIAIGNSASAVDQLVLSERLAGDNRLMNLLTQWAYAYGRAGRHGDAERLFQEIKAAGDKGARPGAGGWAMANLGIGDQKAALDSLERAAQKAANHEPDEGFFGLLDLELNLTNDPVLRKPEFVRVLSRIKGD